LVEEFTGKTFDGWIDNKRSDSKKLLPYLNMIVFYYSILLTVNNIE